MGKLFQSVSVALLGAGLMTGLTIANAKSTSAKSTIKTVWRQQTSTVTYRLKTNVPANAYAYTSSLKKKTFKLSKQQTSTFKTNWREIVTTNWHSRTYRYVKRVGHPSIKGWVWQGYLRKVATPKPAPKPTSTTTTRKPKVDLNQYYSAGEQQQIATYKQQAASINNSTKNIFVTTPSLTGAFNPGTLSDTFIKANVDWINFWREMYGLSAIQADQAWTTEAQYGAATLAAGDQGLSHGLEGLTQPNNVSDTDWSRGAHATNQSNLGEGTKTPYDSISDFINDSGNEVPGHRLWLLGGLGKVGVGYAVSASGDPYSDLMVFNTDDDAETTSPTEMDFPKQGLFPVAMAKGTRWSVSLSQEVETTDTPTVKITDMTTGTPVSVTNVELSNENYGDFGTTISYQPDDDAIKVNHQYSMTISGIANVPDISYTTKLFNLDVSSELF